MKCTDSLNYYKHNKYLLSIYGAGLIIKYNFGNALIWFDSVDIINPYIIINSKIYYLDSYCVRVSKRPGYWLARYLLWELFDSLRLYDKLTGIVKCFLFNGNDFISVIYYDTLKLIILE